MEKEQVLDISWDSIVRIFIAIFVLYIIYLGREIVLWLFFALSVSVLLDPAINFLRKLRIPKIISAALIYLSIFGILGLIIYLTAPIFIFELKQLSQSLPDYFEKINPALKQMCIDFSQGFDEFIDFFM